MNKNDECDIVKDLAASYMENIINDKSKIFIKEHLKTCANCKKYYNDINSKILTKNKNEEVQEKYELDFLKKIRKKMNMLKIFLIIIVIIIGVLILSIFTKCQIVGNIVNNSYEKINYLKNLNNYKLIKDTIDINYTENTTYKYQSNYYYKDGKYKFDFNNGNNVFYYKDNSYNKICIYNELKQIDYYTQNFIEYKKGDTFKEYSEIIMYKESGLYKLMLSIRIDKFNDTDCYVIKNGNDKSYREIWIDKDTDLVLRRVEEEYSKYYREDIYTLIEDKVMDSDVDCSIIEKDDYKDYVKKDVTNNATKEVKNIYDLEY